MKLEEAARKLRGTHDTVELARARCTEAEAVLKAAQEDLKVAQLEHHDAKAELYGRAVALDF